MNLLRSLMFVFIMLIITPPLALIIILSFPLPPRVRLHSVKPFVNSTIWLIENVLGIRHKLIGAENIPQSACVVLAKHQSMWETLVLQKIFRDTVFVYKRELHWVPFIGWGLAATPMIAIDRTAGRDALRQLASLGGDRLAQGFTVAIFPEGTRTKPGTSERHKPGGAHLAAKAGAVVVPLAQNSGECWGNHLLDKRPGTVTVSVGPAINPVGLTTSEVGRRAETWIEAEMRRISPHLYPS